MTSPVPQLQNTEFKRKRGRPRKYAVMKHYDRGVCVDMKPKNKPKKKLGRPRKVKEIVKEIVVEVEEIKVEVIEVSPTPSPRSLSPSPPPLHKRIMMREDVDKRVNYLKRRLSVVLDPVQQHKYRNLILKYQRDVEII